MSTKPKPERYAIVLQAMPDQDGVPTIIRLRRFLKAALRSYRLRCVRCEPLQDEAHAVAKTVQRREG